MKLVFSREDVLGIMRLHVADLLECDPENLEASSPYYSDAAIEITVLTQPKPIPTLHKVVTDFGQQVEVA